MIFSKILSLKEATLQKNPLTLFSERFLVLIFGCLTLLVCCSCGTTKTIPIETVKEVTRTDTLYINYVQYDSIFISQNSYIDRTKDTILIRQHDVKYRYKLLRDTIEHIKLEVRHDSIPYEVRIIETKQVKYTSPWTKALAYIGSITILILLIYIFTRLKRF